MSRRNLLRSWLTAALSIAAVLAVALLGVRPVPAGAAAPRGHFVSVSDAGFGPPIVSDANVGDVLIFHLNQTDDQHTVTFEAVSSCPGERGAVPCWPELRFDTDTANCDTEFGTPASWRCLEVREPGVTVRFYDALHKANIGEVRVLGQPTTTTGPGTPTTTAPTTTTTTLPSTTTTTWSQTTTTTAPTQIRPFVVPDPPSTTSTMAPAAPATVTSNGGTPAPSPNKDKDKNNEGRDKGKSKGAAAETPPPLTPAPSDALPPDSVFDPAALTPGPIEVPDASGDPADGDAVDLESAAIMNLLERSDEPADRRPLLLALGALAFLLALGGIWRWFTRPSRYDPA